MAEQDNTATQESGLLAKWETVANRFETISHQLADPAVLSQPSRLVSLNKERAEIEEPARLFFSYRELLEEITGTERMLQDVSLDPELRSLAEEEIQSLRVRQEDLERTALDLMHPQDMGDTKNTFVDIRAGAGGH